MTFPKNPIRSSICILSNRLLLAGLLVFSLSGCRCPWSCTNANLADSSRWFQSGIEAFNDGDHQEAETLISQAVESRPEDPILREHLANVYVEKDETQSAIEQLMKAAELSNQDVAILVRIGNLYLKNDQLIPAKQYAKQAITSDRKHPEAWVLLADTKLANGNLNEAIKDYQRALSLKNDFPEVQIKIAELHRLLGRPLRAFSTVEQMLSQLPPEQQPEPALLLAGKLLIELEQPTQAIEKLSLATRNGQASEQTYLELASAQISVGREAEAYGTLVAARKRFPSSNLIAKQYADWKVNNRRFAALDINGDQIIR